MALNIDTYWVLNIAGVEVWITETIVNTWAIMLLLTVFAIFVCLKLKSFKIVPTKFQNVIEAIVETFDNFAFSALGEKLSYISPWFFMVFVFVLLSSLVSVFGVRAPTADFATTFAFAIVTFVLMVFMGIKHRKRAYFKGFAEPHFIFFPINIMGEMAKPVSLSFRLFGNMLSGTIILALYYELMPRILHFPIPALLSGFFNVIIGLLQTYIFVIVSLMYIRGAAD
jgi:F-type H+-transporting ATPase subunit a